MNCILIPVQCTEQLTKKKTLKTTVGKLFCLFPDIYGFLQMLIVFFLFAKSKSLQFKVCVHDLKRYSTFSSSYLKVYNLKSVFMTWNDIQPSVLHVKRSSFKSHPLWETLYMVMQISKYTILSETRKPLFNTVIMYFNYKLCTWSCKYPNTQYYLKL